jgi:hypothetical protein
MGRGGARGADLDRLNDCKRQDWLILNGDQL